MIRTEIEDNEVLIYDDYTVVDHRVFLGIPEIQKVEIKDIQNLEIKKIQEKLDGEFIQPILINGEIQMKSKKSFDTIVARKSQEMVDSDCDLKFFILDTFDLNFYPLFQFWDDKLYLIGVRNEDGQFIDVDKFDYPDKPKHFSDLDLKPGKYIIKVIDKNEKTKERLVQVEIGW